MYWDKENTEFRAIISEDNIGNSDISLWSEATRMTSNIQRDERSLERVIKDQALHNTLIPFTVAT